MKTATLNIGGTVYADVQIDDTFDDDKVRAILPDGSDHVMTAAELKRAIRKPAASADKAEAASKAPAKRSRAKAPAKAKA